MVSTKCQSSMFSSKLCTTFLFSMTLAFLLQTCFGSEPLRYFCLNFGNFAAQSPYDLNLETLIFILNYKTPSTGFGVRSEGNYPGQKAYGLTLCRGDVSASECKTCVSDATKEIRNRCSYDKGAILWYDNCMFKYSDYDFFGKIDNTNKLYLWNPNDANDPSTFNYKTRELLSQLALQASMNPKLYATGELKLDKYTLYGLTQCTRDLSTTNCKKCIDDIINEFPNCCNGKVGGRILVGSCNFRYETYPFLKQ